MRQQKSGIAPSPHFQKGAPARGIDSPAEVPCRLRLSQNIMEIPTNHQPGGIAAETPNINSNQEPDSNIDMNEMNDSPITLKQAAAKFDCAASSLKNNIKSGKLAATQTNEKAPYMVRYSDVDRFLRDTLGIASIFHPAASNPAPAAAEPASADETSAVMTGQEAESPTSKVAGGGHESAAEAALTAAAETSGSDATAVDHGSPARVPDVHANPSAQTAEGGTKRRRRRRRGKGGAGSPTPTGIQQPVLKALAGTTPQERLRLTACLTELLGLVASA